MFVTMPSICKRGITLAGACALAMTAFGQDKPLASTNPRPGQPGHRSHVEWQGDYPTPDSIRKFKLKRTLPMPEGFIGNLAYDGESGRLWLVSLGPPTNAKGPSMIYEVDPNDGKVLAKAELPFKGDFGEPVFYDGYLYQGVFHESKVYKIVAGDRDNLGKIDKVIPLPTLIDLKLGDEAHSYPFIEFGGLTLTPDKNLMFHADDVGELITVERESGKLLARARTLKALGGISAIAGQNGEFLVLGNSDPRGGYCALSYPPSLSRSPEQKDISWAILDGKTGNVLASIRTQNSPAYASTVKIVKREDVPGSPYGKFTFLATGEQGILELEWTPVRESY